jgi:hypothetical protein
VQSLFQSHWSSESLEGGILLTIAVHSQDYFALKSQVLCLLATQPHSFKTGLTCSSAIGYHDKHNPYGHSQIAKMPLMSMHLLCSQAYQDTIRNALGDAVSVAKTANQHTVDTITTLAFWESFGPRSVQNMTHWSRPRSSAPIRSNHY